MREKAGMRESAANNVLGTAGQDVYAGRHSTSTMTGLLLRKSLSTILFSACAALGMADTVPLDENLVAIFADLHITADTNPPHQRAGFVQCVADTYSVMLTRGFRDRKRAWRHCVCRPPANGATSALCW